MTAASTKTQSRTRARRLVLPWRKRSAEVESYWTDHLVRATPFESAVESERYLEWRFSEYPLFREFMSLWGDHSGKVVLDYGCGPGDDVVGFLLHSGASRVVGVDVSQTALSLARRRVDLHAIAPERVCLLHVREGSRRLPLEKDSIDHVNSGGVLHHVTHPLRVLRELRRVLAPSGSAAVMVYNRESIYFHLYTAYMRMVVNGDFAGLSVEEAFSRNTDGPACPISRAYTAERFGELCRRAGFAAEFVGGYFNRHELDWLDEHSDAALASPQLPPEHKRFLEQLERDPEGLPLYDGKHAGIGGVYRLEPT